MPLERAPARIFASNMRLAEPSTQRFKSRPLAFGPSWPCASARALAEEAFSVNFAAVTPWRSDLEGCGQGRRCHGQRSRPSRDCLPRGLRPLAPAPLKGVSPLVSGGPCLVGRQGRSTSSATVSSGDLGDQAARRSLHNGAKRNRILLYRFSRHVKLLCTLPSDAAILAIPDLQGEPDVRLFCFDQP